MKKNWLKILKLPKKNGLQQSSFLRIFSLDMEKAFLKNSPQTFSPKARKISTHSPEKFIRRLIFVNYLIFSQTFSSTRKMQLWQPCRTFFAKNQHVLVQCLTILIKRFIFERKIFTSKLPLGHEEYCLSNSAKKFLAKSMIGFGSKYDNEHQKKYLFEIIQFLQRKFSWTRRKQF